MSRHLPGGSYSHRVTRIGPGHYRMSWMVDRYYASSRLRHPTSHTRDTDQHGAERFAKRWDLKVLI